MDSIRIEISGNAEALQPTINKLEELGAVDKKNAEQFKKTNAEYALGLSKRQEAIKAELIQLEQLKKARDKAFNPENIQGYNKSIAISEAKIRALSDEMNRLAGGTKRVSENLKQVQGNAIASSRGVSLITKDLIAAELATKGVGKSMASVVENTNNLGTSVKKGYGFLRLMANVLPGLGISGIIMYGWDALSAIIEKVSEDFTKLDTAQTNFNTAGIQATNEFTISMKKFREEIELLIIQQNILNGTQTEQALKNQQLVNAYGKDVLDIKQSTIQKKQILMDAMSELYKERNRILEENRQKGLTGLMLGDGEDYDKAKALYDKKTTELGKLFSKLGDEQRRLEAEALKKFLEGRNLVTAEKDAERKKLIRDASYQDLENQKKNIEAQFKVESSYYKDNISDSLELIQQLYYIEEAKNEEILLINEELATRKKNQDVKNAKATITDQDALNNRLYNINLAYNDKISGLRNDYFDASRVAYAQYYSSILKEADKASEENAKEVQVDLNKRKKAIQYAEVNLADTLKLANETAYTEGKITQEEHDKQDIRDQLTVLELKKTNLMKYSNEYIEIEIKEQELKRQLKEKEKKDMKKDVKEQIDNLQQIADFAFKIIEDQIKANIDAIDRQQDMQKDAIDVQRKQAELGHENTLAFEEKRMADLERDRMKEQKKLIKLKELETFMNAIASYSKDDPNGAVAKALAQLALVKGVEATFMEEGGLLGKTKEKSWLGRTHKGGGDILVHAQTGEGILSRNDIAHMGGEQAFMNFKNMLGNNQLPQIPLSGVMFNGFDTKKLEDRIMSLEQTIRDKPEWQIDWVSKGDQDYRRELKIAKGVKDEVLVQLKKPRI